MTDSAETESSKGVPPAMDSFQALRLMLSEGEGVVDPDDVRFMLDVAEATHRQVMELLKRASKNAEVGWGKYSALVIEWNALLDAAEGFTSALERQGLQGLSHNAHEAYWPLRAIVSRRKSEDGRP